MPDKLIRLLLLKLKIVALLFVVLLISLFSDSFSDSNVAAGFWKKISASRKDDSSTAVVKSQNRLYSGYVRYTKTQSFFMQAKSYRCPPIHPSIVYL